MKRWALFSVIGVASASAACASILGIQDGILDNSVGADGGDSGPELCIADGGGHPDTSSGIFVVAGAGSDDNECGSESHPCLTIGYALTKAANIPSINTVYLANGIYNETVTLKAGLTIEGGWADIDGVWDRVCSVSDPQQAAVIIGTSPITIKADDINSAIPGAATLRFLNINTSEAAPGSSVYGIFADGTTQLLLDNVVLDIGDAGDGKDGDAGSAGESPLSGDCTPGSGQTYEAGAPGSPANLSILSADGVVPQTGGSGGSGSAGGNGPPGADGGCVACKNCVAVTSCGTAAGTSCGGEGSAGCGGGAGSGGFPGQSGGSSIGIFAWGPGVSVTVLGGTITTGYGGRGGAGGPPGAGGIGSVGNSGDAGASCLVACSGACLGTNTSGSGTGGEGSRGGNGSSGGPGGGGAGGDSFAIVVGADAAVDVDAGAALKHGSGGPNAAGGSGQSGDYNP